MSTTHLNAWVKHANASPNTPPKMVEAVVYVADTMVAANAICQDLYGQGRFTPGDVLDVYRTIEAKRNPLGVYAVGEAK